MLVTVALVLIPRAPGPNHQSSEHKAALSGKRPTFQFVYICIATPTTHMCEILGIYVCTHTHTFTYIHICMFVVGVQTFAHLPCNFASVFGTLPIRMSE